MPRITKDQMIGGFAQVTPEQLLLIEWFYSQFDRLPAGGGNRHIANVEPLFYIGAIAGSEFLTYAATKLYICFKFEVNGGLFGSAVGAFITFFNEANALNYYLGLNMPVYDTVAAAHLYSASNALYTNGYFSRITTVQYSHIIFNGYRITLD